MYLKRLILVLTMIFAMTTLLVGCGDSAKPSAGTTTAPAAKEVRVAIQPFPLYSPIYVAKQKGWLEEELKPLGVTVKWSSFNSGPLVNESFAAGQQDIGVMGDVPAIVAKAAGQNNRIIGTAAYGPQALAFVVAADSPITSPQELKGKKVAFVKGSYAHHLAVLVLKNAGLTVNDIQAVNLGASDMPGALINKDIDAAVIWEPFITKMQEEKTGKVLIDGTGIKRGELVIFARDEFAKQNPEVAKAFLKAYKRGYEFIKANPAEAAALISPDIKLPADQLTKVLGKFDFNPVIRAEDIDELKKSEEFMREAGIIKNGVNIDAFVDKTYLQQAGI